MMKRRQALELLTATMSAPAILSSSAALAQTVPFDPRKPEHVALAFRKLNWSMDSAVTVSWIKAMRYALIDSAFTPLWELHAGILFKVNDAPEGNGAYDVTMMAATYYTDIETGKPIETFKNPFTGQTVTFPFAQGNAPKVAIRKQRFTTQGGIEPPRENPGLKVTVSQHHYGPAWVEGEDVWVRGDNISRLIPEPANSGKRMLQVNDWSTYKGLVKDVMNPDNKNPKSSMAFNDINTWPAWLGMEDRPGNYVSRGFGRKEHTYEALPAVWREMFAARNPAIAKDPRAALEG